MSAVYNHIPENWSDMSHQEKSVWLARHCTNYTREGEVEGIREDVPQDVMNAYQSFLEEDN
jgi:hypothetical protein